MEVASRHLEQQLVSTRGLVKETIVAVRKCRGLLCAIAGLWNSQVDEKYTLIITP